MSTENETSTKSPTPAPVHSSDGLGGGKDLVGAMYRGSDGAMTCALCHCEMEWGECNACGGDGGHDGYEEDPLWYHPGEIAQCCQCNGRGGSWWCETTDCETGEGWKTIEAPKP